jgi:hypothetical protein
MCNEIFFSGSALCNYIRNFNFSSYRWGVALTLVLPLNLAHLIIFYKEISAKKI